MSTLLDLTLRDIGATVTLTLAKGESITGVLATIKAESDLISEAHLGDSGVRYVAGRLEVDVVLIVGGVPVSLEGLPRSVEVSRG